MAYIRVKENTVIHDCMLIIYSVCIETGKSLSHLHDIPLNTFGTDTNVEPYLLFCFV